MDPWREKGLSFERLKSLVRMSTEGGLAKAAPGDVARQNLIGRQLRELESFFGIPLISKRGKTVMLNENGQKLAAVSAQVLSLIEDFKRTAAGKRRVFRLAAGGSLYVELASQRLAALKGRGLEIHLCELRHDQIFNALMQGTVDAAIAWAPPPSSYQLREISLGSFGYSVFGARTLISAGMSDEELLRLPFVIVKYRDFSEDIKHRLQEGAGVYVDENIAALRLVESGGFAAILPAIFAAHLPSSKFRRYELEFLRRYAREVRYVWNPRTATSRGFSQNWISGVASAFRIEGR